VELRAFLDGTHPAYANLSGSDLTTARQRIEQLRPAILKALNPTPNMLTADRVLTNISDITLKEGQRLGFLNSRWTPDEYIPHILHPKGAGDLPTSMGDRVGKALGGKNRPALRLCREARIPLAARSRGSKLQAEDVERPRRLHHPWRQVRHRQGYAFTHRPIERHRHGQVGRER
jgi:hypothetical protein